MWSGQSEDFRQLSFEQYLRQSVIGQQGAISTVAATMRRKQKGWGDEGHPLVFLFLGSSGTGKTELCKKIAKYIHKDNPQGLVRLDMSEYQDKEHGVTKLIGGSSYSGRIEGNLTRQLYSQTDAVVLLDEIEKAHPDILMVLLQVFDEGRITNGQGNLIMCNDAIFIMTSNLAAAEITNYGLKLQQGLDLQHKKMEIKYSLCRKSIVKRHNIDISPHFKKTVVHPILKKHFQRDEFLGRINEIVFFLPFTREEILSLVSKQLKIWAKKAQIRHSIELGWERGVIHCLANGYDVSYGSRSIKGEIERRVINKIALAAEKGLVNNGSTIIVTSHDDQICIRVKKYGRRRFILFE